MYSRCELLKRQKRWREMTPGRAESRKLNELEKEVIWKKKKKSVGEWKSSRSFKISQMTAHIWAASSLSIAQRLQAHTFLSTVGAGGQWRNGGKKEQSSYLGRPSSGVPDLKGKQEHSQQRTRDHGKLCDTDTQASRTEQMSVLLEECREREEWDGERERRVHGQG